ncbi:MAG TPA: PRC-barrel domain-containing protein, partial [Chloroflexota bacterium]|nr:PRC-barrel domain-containing protein [Chloroflexota bacterium]
MNVELGAHVRTRDGRDVGVVDKLIWDPQAERVKAVAIRKGFILHRDVEVPVTALRAGPGGELRLDCTADQVDELPAFDESSYTTPPVDYVAAAGRPAPGVLWPVGYGAPAVAPLGAEAGLDPHVREEIASALYARDLENEVIGQGSTVKSRDGEKVGEVHRLTFDPETGQLTGLVVRRGFLLTEDVELPASLVASVGDEVIYLNLDASGLRATR